jgi:DNA-binding response OmpR family regulator
VSRRAALRVAIVNSFDSGPMYAEFLRSRDLVVHCLTSPEAALPQLGDLAPDVIVTDFVFRHSSSDGPAFIRSVRSVSGFADVPIVVVSGYVSSRRSDASA